MKKRLRTVKIHTVHPTITSVQNPKIKHLLSLEKPRHRREQGLFVMEGRKEVGLALQGDYKINSLFFSGDLITPDELQQLGVADDVLIPVSQEVFNKIAIRENTGGIVAVAQQKKHELNTTRLGKNPLVLVLESVEKPGNLGAVLRTADAAGVDAVIICDPKTDFYNPNVIRSSIGCVFTMQVASATSQETLVWLEKNSITPFSTYLKASRAYHTVDFTKPSAIVMGTEATGLSETWIGEHQNPIIIPMQGHVDSMNVSVAAAIIIYEARRQRGFS